MWRALARKSASYWTTGRFGVARMCAESQRSAIHDASNRKHFYIPGLMTEKAEVSGCYEK